MVNIFDSLNQLVKENPIFWLCALLGSGLFIVQLILSFFGAAEHDTIDQGYGDFDTINFKWLSKQALTGFLMMFGWIGLTCHIEFHLSKFASISISLLGSLLAVLIIGLIFRGAKKLRSPGMVYNIEDVIGKEATIYQRIPRDGAGKISISLSNLTYEIDAISQAPEELPSFTRVQIIKKADEKTVVVVPIK